MRPAKSLGSQDFRKLIHLRNLIWIDVLLGRMPFIETPSLAGRQIACFGRGGLRRRKCLGSRRRCGVGRCAAEPSAVAEPTIVELPAEASVLAESAAAHTAVVNAAAVSAAGIRTPAAGTGNSPADLDHRPVVDTAANTPVDTAAAYC